MRHIRLITTGGTIEKTYDEASGTLVNRQSIVRKMLARLRLEDTLVDTVELLHKDSQDFTDDDRSLILAAVRSALSAFEPEKHACGVVILHGTDTLENTGDFLLGQLDTPSVPVVLAGAMRPYDVVRSDALQNLTEALFAATMLDPGIYCVCHGRALAFPGVRKDRGKLTFIRQSEGE